MTKTIILASASARRVQILNDMNVPFEQVIPNVDEVYYKNDAQRTVKENAIIKNNWAVEKYSDRIILTADTLVALDGHVIEKPKSMEEARSFLQRFSGNSHTVFTTVAISQPNHDLDVRTAESIVTFKVYNDDTITEYFTKVDPMDKAGAYDINQQCDLVIESYSGSRTNIMGLPAELTAQMLNLQEE